MLDAAIRQSINDSVLCWLATADAQGQPNVSPKEIFLAYGEASLLIANIASPNSVSNIKENPAVCVSFVDVFKQKGFKLVGNAAVMENGDPGYEPRLKELSDLAGETIPIRSLVEVTIESTAAIVAPSYWLFPETTEQGQVEQAMKAYGVRSRD